MNHNQLKNIAINLLLIEQVQNSDMLLARSYQKLAPPPFRKCVT
jgi:hypothetical protein